MKLSEDEARLVALFRALPTADARSDLLSTIGSDLLHELFPGGSIYDFMPEAAGFIPTGEWHRPGTNAHIISCGIEATGDPISTLMGTSDWDDSETIPRFEAGATAEANEQGSWFRFSSEFAQEYISEWRQSLVQNIVRKRNEKLAEAKD